MSIYEAIFNRCSVREYEMEKLAPGRLEALERYLKNIALLDEEKTVKFEIIDNSDGKQKIHGLWKARGAVLSLQSIAGMTSCPCGMPDMRLSRQSFTSHQRNSEPVISGRRRPERRKRRSETFPRDRVRTAAGRPSRDSSLAHRASLAALCAFKDEPGEQVKAILRAARLAPSSFNSQPWRFVVYSDRIYIFAKKTLPFSGKEKRAFKEFNIGIMLSHIMLAAEELWMNMETQVEDQFAKKDYKNGEYVCTIMFHS